MEKEGEANSLILFSLGFFGVPVKETLLSLRHVLKKEGEVNALSPNSDHHRVSPCDIIEVMRIKNITTHDEFS